MSTQYWNDRDSFSIEETINSFLWLMWCSEERGSRITVLSWSLIPSQQDNNNNTMTSLDKQRHIHFESGLIDNPFFREVGHHYYFIVPMLEQRSVISVSVHRNNWDRKIISRWYWRDGPQSIAFWEMVPTLPSQCSPCLSGQFRQDNRRAWRCQGKYVWR